MAGIVRQALRCRIFGDMAGARPRMSCDRGAQVAGEGQAAPKQAC